VIRRLTLALLIGLSALTASPHATAAGQAIAGSLVHVYVAGPREAVLRTQAVLPELLARIRLQATVEPANDESVLAAAATDAVPRAFLDFRSTAAPRVILVERPQGKELERRTLPASTSLEVAVEESAHVLYMALESALHARPENAAATAGAAASPGSATAGSAGSPGNPASTAGEAATPDAGTDTAANAPTASAESNSAAPRAGEEPTTREAASSETRAKPPSPESEDRQRPPGHGAPLPFAARLSAFGGVSSFQAEHVLPTAGGALDAAFGTGTVRGGAWLSFGASFPSTVSNRVAGSVRAESLRLAATAEWLAWPRVGFVLGAGGGVDRVTFDPGASTPALQAGTPTTRANPLVATFLGARFRIAGGFGAFALAALDVDLTPHRYVAAMGLDAPAPIFTLPRLRPAAFAGLSYVFYDGTPKRERSR
jgi:hypothetical protein